MTSYISSKTILEILKAGLRKVTNYAEGDEPSNEAVASAFEAWQLIVSDLENNKGIRIFKVASRQRVFEPSSVVTGSDGLVYRCTRTHDVKNIQNWASKSFYSNGDAVYPATYNGYYYECSNDNGGLSGDTAPSFPTYQDSVVADNVLADVWTDSTAYGSGDIIKPTVANGYFFYCVNAGTSDSSEPDWNQAQVVDGTVIWNRYENIVWKCVPDTKPIVGKNYSTYWMLDDSGATPSTYTVNATYRCCADFDMPADELFIKTAFIRNGSQDNPPLEIIDKDTFSNFSYKGETGEPKYLYVDYKDINTVTAHLYPIPKNTGATGYILNYETVLKMPYIDNPTLATGFIDRWLRFFPFAIASDIAPEYNVDMSMCVYLDKKAAALFELAYKADKPKTSSRRVSSCY